MGRNTDKKSLGKIGANKNGASKDGRAGAGDAAIAVTGPEEAILRGIAAAERGDKGEAHNIFSETVELYPSTPEAWVWLGGTSPDLDNAESAFEKAYALDPDNERASLGLRWVRLQRKAALSDMAGAPASVPAPSPALAPSPDSPSWTGLVSAPLAAAAAGGQATAVKCPNCGNDNGPGEKFCQSCGQDLQAALASDTSPQPFIQPVPVKHDGATSRYMIAAGIVLVLLAVGIVLFLVLNR